MTPRLIFQILGLIFVLAACSDENPVPKPSTYLRMNLPEHSYRVFKSDCPYSMKLSNLYFASAGEQPQSNYCVQEIDLGPLNGKLFLYYLRLPSKDSLPEIINFANDKVDEHKIKADKINFEQIVQPKKKVYGTFFELKGNVATNFQFYLTDSSTNFVRGEVLLNCRPNYDSLRPTLEYLKQDLLELVRHFEWKK
jgi:gliding motility-associated lipoprotein GldD